jgi:hypothetical protein
MFNVYPLIQTEEEMTDVVERVKKFYFRKNEVNRGTLTQLEKVLFVLFIRRGG